MITTIAPTTTIAKIQKTINDYIKSEEDALRMYKSLPEEYYDQIAIDYLTKEIAWAKKIEANKNWEQNEEQR